MPDPVPRPQTVPAELTGKFVAWTPDGLRILGSGDTPEEARIRAGGTGGVLIEWIPPAEELRSIPLGEFLSRLPHHEQDAIEASAAELIAEEKAEREFWCPPGRVKPRPRLQKEGRIPMPRPDSPALAHLYDRFVGNDPEQVAAYEAALAEAAAQQAAYDAPPTCRCLDAGGCPDLAAGKLYRRLPDAEAAAEGLWRVVDDSGEDYLFASDSFRMEEPPDA